VIHNPTRRSLLTTTVSATSLLLANRLFGDPAPHSTQPNPELEKLGTVAKANSAAQATPVQLAPVKAYRDRWTSKFDRDPFSISMDEKLDTIHSAAVRVTNDFNFTNVSDAV